MDTLEINPLILYILIFLLALLFPMAGIFFRTLRRHRSALETLEITNDDLAAASLEIDRLKNSLVTTEDQLTSCQEKLNQQQQIHLEDLNRILQLTNYDPITGFMQSDTFIKAMDNFIADDTPFTLVYITIANLKEVSNSLGFTAYESLMQTISESIQLCLGTDHYQFGIIKHDNFLILTKRSPHLIDNDLPRLLRLFDHQFFSDFFSFKLLAKIGLATYPDDALKANDLVKKAGIAAMNKLDSPISEVTHFSKAMHESDLDAQRKFAEIDQALKDKRFLMYYQPKFALDGKKILGYEALIRLRTSAGKICSPCDFIDYAEHTGQILYIGRQVIEMVCNDIKKYELDKRGIHISLNLSSQHLESAETITFLKRTVNKYDLDTRYIELEVTETSLVKNYELTRSMMLRLKNDGFTIALDDFGTGYSSLSYIRNLPINKIKIDREFISRMPNVKYMKVLKAIMNLSKDLYYKVTVEGIETKEQWEMLKPFEPTELQGFYFSKPLPIEDAVKLL